MSRCINDSAFKFSHFVVYLLRSMAYKDFRIRLYISWLHYYPKQDIRSDQVFGDRTRDFVIQESAPVFSSCDHYRSSLQQWTLAAAAEETLQIFPGIRYRDKSRFSEPRWVRNIILLFIILIRNALKISGFDWQNSIFFTIFFLLSILHIYNEIERCCPNILH